MNKIRVNTLIFLLGLSLFSAYAQQNDTAPIVVANNPVQNIFQHTVERGQTVYSLAKMYGVSEEDIYRLNPGSRESIKAGSVLNIPQRDVASGPAITSTDELYTYHTIQPKETLYSLTTKYGVPASELVEANPGLSVATFTIGRIVRIPAMNINGLPTTEIQIVPREIEYTVERRETLYRISRKFGVSSAELIERNPELRKGLKAGMVIKIPVQTKEELVSVPDAPREADVNALLSAPRTVNRVNTMKVAVLLPFMASESRRSAESTRVVEYYEGLLLAVDSLKNMGIPIELDVRDTEGGIQSVANILRDESLKETNLIIGGVQNDQIKLIADFAKEHDIKYVIPFTSRNDDVLSNASVFQVNTPLSYLYAKAAQSGCVLFAGYNIILLDTQDDKDKRPEFISAFKTEMEQRNIMYKECTWQAATFQRDIEAMLSNEKPNVIVPLSASIEALNKIKAPLRGIAEMMPGYRLTLFGYPDWQTYTRDCLEDFFALNTYIYSHFYADNLSGDIHEFYTKYKTWYSKDMINYFPKYGILGFDTGMFFFNAINRYGSNFENNLQNIRYKSLQTSFDFNRVNNWGGFINTQLFIVHYRSDYSIVRQEVIL